MLVYGGSRYVHEVKKKTYKVGDRVKIKSLNIVWEVKNRGYEFPGYWNCGMNRYCGKEAVIRSVGVGYCGEDYHLDIDDGFWTWTYHMFETENRKIMENE